jgi:hypothetical protein
VRCPLAAMAFPLRSRYTRIRRGETDGSKLGPAPLAAPFPRGSTGRRCSINATPLLAPKRDPSQSQIDRPEPIAAPPESGEAADRDGGAHKTTTEKAAHPAQSTLLGNRQETRDGLLEQNGFPEPGDGGQAKHERYVADVLGAWGHHPAESTIRAYVRKWIDEYRARVNNGSPRGAAPKLLIE